MAEHLFLVLPEPNNSVSSTSDILTQDNANATTLVFEVNRICWLLDVEDFVILYDRNNVREYFKLFMNEKDDHYTYKSTLRNLFYKNDRFEQWNATSRKTLQDKITIYGVPQSNWNSFCEVAKRESECHDVPKAIVNYDVQKLNSQCITATVNGRLLMLQVVQFSFDGISTWLETHRVPERRYEWNPKHGEYGKGAHTEQKGRGEVSVLLSGRDDPKKLLPKAIGHKIVHKGESHNNLYVYDEQYSKFLRFMFDSGTQTYHAFHTPWTKLPEEIKKKYIDINPKVAN